MSKNIGYHSFTHSTSGSVIHVDVELHENIDYNFFETVDETVPNNHAQSEETHKDKKSNLKVNSDLKTVDFKQTSANENVGSTVRFSTVTELDDGEKFVSTKQDKHTKLRELMNCIAYGSENKEKGNQEEEDHDDKMKSPSPDFLSLSTDTTSEITSVTTRPSSSGCSSMGKFDFEENLLDKKETDLLKNLDNNRGNNDNIGSSSMKLLLDALDSFDKQEAKSTTSSILSSTRRQRGRKNMSFSNEQLRKIDRENEILVRKLENLRKPRPKPQPSVPVSCPRLSSSAINRKRQQRKIEHDNMILLKKIETARPSPTIALSSLRR